MAGFRLLIVPVLTWLCLYATALPPINSPPSLNLASLNDINRTASFAVQHHRDITRPPVGPAFPPRADLPEYFPYKVPFSKPRMILEFGDYDDHPERNETQCGKLFEKAVRDALSPRHLPDEKLESDPYEINYERQRLIVKLETEHEEVTEFLTWRQWVTALTGLNNFRLAYPGLYYRFDIYVFPDDQEKECMFWGAGNFEHLA